MLTVFILGFNYFHILGLGNGAFGTIKDIIYPANKSENILPETMIIHFPNYIGPQFDWKWIGNVRIGSP